jgi:hypothetical protein
MVQRTDKSTSDCFEVLQTTKCRARVSETPDPSLHTPSHIYSCQHNVSYAVEPYAAGASIDHSVGYAPTSIAPEQGSETEFYYLNPTILGNTHIML